MEHIENAFKKMGARIKLGHTDQRTFTVDVRHDKKGEYFDVRTNGSVEVNVPHIDPKLRHLLLNFRVPTGKFTPPDKSTVLCGHDEREWFTSQLNQGVTTIKQAFEQLKPPGVQEISKKLKRKNKNKRKNKEFKRQGEFFFIPVEGFVPPKDAIIRKNEPLEVIERGRRGKPHVAAEAYRQGGQTLLFNPRHPEGVTRYRMEELVRQNPHMRFGWTERQVNMTLYVRGVIRHSDHKTLKLRSWHRVELNRELRGANVVFAD